MTHRRVSLALAAIALTLAACARHVPPHWQPAPRALPEKSREPEDQPGEAARYYLERRAPDGRNLPIERYLAARDYTRRMPLYSSAARRFAAPGAKPSTRRDLSLGQWQELGPGNVGGRTRALVIHPSDPAIMYAGGVAGGVWKTTNAGRSWAPLSDFLPSLAVSTLALDPKNPDVLYAGTGEGFNNSDAVRGAGILKSTDAGASWNQLPPTAVPSFYYVNKLVISPVDSVRIYAATGDGIWRSTDSGETWTRALAAPEGGCQDLVIRTDQGADYLFAACGQGAVQARIYRNTDASGEGKWEVVYSEANMARTTLALAPSNQAVVYALATTSESGDKRNGLLAVLRSTSNGDSGAWEARVRNTSDDRLAVSLLSNPRELFRDICFNQDQRWLNQGWYDNVIAVDPTNPDRVWAGGIDLFRSEDGGVTWGLASYWWSAGPAGAHADHHALVFHPQYDGVNNKTLFSANDGGIYRTEDATAEVATGERAPCSAANTRVAWASLNNGYAVAQFYHGAAYPGGLAYLGGSQDTSTNFGADFLGPNSWLPVRGGDGGYVAVDPTNANIIYVETTNLSLARSNDGGSRFAAATRGIGEPSSNFEFIAPFALDPNEPRNVWIGGRTIWRSNDRGDNWTAASQAFDAGITALAVAVGDSNRVVAGARTGRILRNHQAQSAGRETEWLEARPRTDFVSSLAFDPANPDTVYATYSRFNSGANRGHVFRSTDGGANWTNIDGSGDTAIPDIPVHSIVVDPANAQTLYLGTDLGVFVSLDGGANWAREDTGFPNTVVESLSLDRGGGGATLFAFTHGRGAWRVRLNGVAPCSFTAPESMAVPAIGGGTADLSTADGCAWSAIPLSEWLVPTPANGSGPASVAFGATPNNSTRSRTGGMILGDKAVTVTQSGATAVGGNNEPATASNIGALPYVVIQDTRTATTGAEDPVHSCTEAQDSRTVWFRYTAAADATLEARATLTRYDNGRDAGVVLSLYRGSATAANEGGCVKTAAGGIPAAAALSFPVTAGQTYLLEVSGAGDGNPGGFLLLTLASVGP